jgi:hypothetical protein
MNETAAGDADQERSLAERRHRQTPDLDALHVLLAGVDLRRILVPPVRRQHAHAMSAPREFDRRVRHVLADGGRIGPKDLAEHEERLRSGCRRQGESA